MQPSQHEQSPSSSLWLPLMCAWLLMLFTIGRPESDDLRPLLPEQLMNYAKVFLRLSVLTLMAAMLIGLRNHPRLGKVIWHMIPFWMFAAWALVSTTWSPLQKVTLGQSMGLLTLIALASVIAIKWNGPSVTSAVLYSITLGAGSCSVLLLICYVLLPGAGAMTRNHIGLLHPTNASATASLGLIIIIAARLLWGWTWARRLWLPASLAHAAVLLISMNRLALALTLGLIFLLFLAFSSRVLLTAGIVVSSVLAAAYLALDPGLNLADGSLRAVTDYAGREQSAEELSSLSGRHEMWDAIWASFAESPWIGHGYFVTSSSGELFVWYQWGNWTAHNVYLQLLATTGIIGTVVLGCGVLRLGYLLVSPPSGGRVDWQTKAFLSMVVAWYFFWGMLNESIAGPLQPESVIFYACVGIAAGAASLASPQGSGFGRKPEQPVGDTQ